MPKPHLQIQTEFGESINNEQQKWWQSD